MRARATSRRLATGLPCLIDRLSFDFAAEHGAWPAYGQFCRNFLAPLALMTSTPSLSRARPAKSNPVAHVEIVGVMGRISTISCGFQNGRKPATKGIW